MHFQKPHAFINTFSKKNVKNFINAFCKRKLIKFSKKKKKCGESICSWIIKFTRLRIIINGNYSSDMFNKGKSWLFEGNIAYMVLVTFWPSQDSKIKGFSQMVIIT